MMASTHGIIGAVTFAGASALLGTPQELPISGLTVGAAALGAWLPDVDTPTSKAGFCAYPLALWLERRFGHRTVTHSFFGAAIFALLCAPLFFTAFKVLWPALLIGYASHLLADAATKSGVPLAWPSRARWVFPGNEQYRVKTGSLAELGVLAAFVILGLLLVPVARYGPRRLLHIATASLPGAVRDAEDWGDEWNLEIEVEGYDVLNQRIVSGRFPVVGRRDDGTILIERAGAYWMLKDSGAELYRIAPRHTRVHQAGARRDQTLVVRASNITLAALHRALLESVRGLGTNDKVTARQVLITGAGACYPFPPDTPPTDAPRFGLKTVRFASTRIEFDFAQPRHLEEAGGTVALQDATLSIRLPQEAKLPPLRFPTRRVVVTAAHMRRHADLHVATGQLIRRGTSLQSTFGQTYETELSPDDELRQAQADSARRELVALDAEEDAMQSTRLWPQLRASFTQRRARLQELTGWTLPAARAQPAPSPSRAPFDAVVESIEWEPPTVPTRKGERAEHAARVTLVQVKL